MIKKGKLKFAGFLLSFLIFVSSVCGSGFTVVANGKIVAGLSPEPMAGPEFEAAKILEKYLYLATGDVPEVTEKGRRIVFKIEKGKMDIEGFRLSFPSADKMVISGGSAAGLKYGALEFCERFLGIRFLFPGKLGMHIPKVRDLTVPCKDFADAPKYQTRYLWGSRHWLQKDFHNWYPLLKSAEPYRIKYHHNLYKMFPPAKYAAENPDFYPVIEGRRYIPQAPKLGVHWQPCMTNPKVIDEAVKMICDAFEANPGLRAWSLCQTDGDGYCECENCKKFYPANDVPHRFGSKDRSMLYLQFCNQIAEKVAKKYPDAKLSLYAYNHASIAPKNYRLHPSLVPIITYDRANHADPARKKMDQERQKEWEKISSSVAWYDYVTTGHFVLPRVLTRHIAARLREGYESGVRHFFGEYSPLNEEKLWLDGPFGYVALKFLWNPYQDIDKILADWYRTAVGEKAAPHLQNYFEALEKFWIKTVPHSAWFKRCARTYHVWTWHNYVEDLPAGFLDNCEKELLRCVELAPEGICRERAEHFLRGFRDRRFKVEFFLNNQKARKIADKAFTETVFTDDFNNGIGNWQTGILEGRGGKPNLFSPREGRNNSGALVFPARNGDYSIAEKYFTVTGPGHFFLTVDYRCENTDEKVIPYISSEWCGSDNKILHAAYYSDVHGRNNPGWARMRLKFTAAGALPGRLRIRLYLCGTKKGRVILDNVVIKSTEKDILKVEKKNSK